MIDKRIEDRAKKEGAHHPDEDESAEDKIRSHHHKKINRTGMTPQELKEYKVKPPVSMNSKHFDPIGLHNNIGDRLA